MNTKKKKNPRERCISSEKRQKTIDDLKKKKMLDNKPKQSSFDTVLSASVVVCFELSRSFWL